MKKNHYKKYKSDDNYSSIGNSWLNINTVDYYRHKRLYELLLPILSKDKGAKWLTIGDGRYGMDAIFLHSNRAVVTASDISVQLLEESFNNGLIDNYSEENAEKLSFNDNQFDYILCKESYHHFKRPIIGLYEMIRVAKKAVILIEPYDDYIERTPFTSLFRFIKIVGKKLLGGQSYSKHQFEAEDKNYIYKISIQELEKISISLNFEKLAIKGINNYYLPGVEYEEATSKSKLLKKIKFVISVQNLLMNLKLIQPGLLCAIIFKKPPTVQLENGLINNNYKILHLKKNPYL